MAEHNPLADIVADVVATGRKFRENAKKSKVVPFGSEKVSAATARRRLEKMSPKERGNFVKQVGLEATLKILRGKNGS